MGEEDREAYREKLTLKKIGAKAIPVGAIGGFLVINKFFVLIKQNDILTLGCVFLIGCVLFQGTIFKIFDRWCTQKEKIAQSNENKYIEIERTKQLEVQMEKEKIRIIEEGNLEKYSKAVELEKYLVDNNNSSGNSSVNNSECKIYKIKRSTDKLS